MVKNTSHLRMMPRNALRLHTHTMGSRLEKGRLYLTHTRLFVVHPSIHYSFINTRALSVQYTHHIELHDEPSTLQWRTGVWVTFVLSYRIPHKKGLKKVLTLVGMDSSIASKLQTHRCFLSELF